MGATRVEAVSDARHASRALAEFDLVLVKDVSPSPMFVPNGGTSKRKGGGVSADARRVKWANTTWLKECLICGRMLELPRMD
jgi:hypothetical protein